MHANVLVDYSGHDVELGLKVASGQNDWIGEHSQWLYAAFLFASSRLCVALTYYLAKINRAAQVKRRSRRPRLECRARVMAKSGLDTFRRRCDRLRL